MAYCTSMGFSFGYSKILLLMLLIPVHNLLLCLCKSISDLFQPRTPCRHTTEADASAARWLLLCREYLPVVKFSDLIDPPERCAVCFNDFEGEEEIRRLANCRHVFHRSCLDNWMGNGKKTCPLCRTNCVPDEMQDRYNESLWYWAATGKP
ncbi:hypothetical protein GQ457_06G037970 [Hibiscus cannabinus]